jgi:hypothetical protein
MEGLRILRNNQPTEVLRNMAQILSNPQLARFGRFSRMTAILTFITVISGMFDTFEEDFSVHSKAHRSSRSQVPLSPDSTLDWSTMNGP